MSDPHKPRDIRPETRAENLVDLLWDHMKRESGQPDRRQTSWGSKTKDGLVASIERICQCTPLSEPEEDVCPESPDGKHAPDWRSVSTTHDGGESYIDINCKHCGRSGCVGSSASLTADINW